MKNTNEQNKPIRKPKLVLNNATKLYLASKEISDENVDDLFFVLALFLPVNKGNIILQPQTEMMTFDDVESARIYSETLSKYCAYNAKTQPAKMAQFAIEEFKQNTK